MARAPTQPSAALSKGTRWCFFSHVATKRLFSGVSMSAV
jgi:hypothetical protein